MSRRGSDFAYRQAVAKRVTQRDRSRGLSHHDAASEWLRLNPDERKRFARAVRSKADLAAWEDQNARRSGRAPP
jgi:hypothetical protein